MVNETIPKECQDCPGALTCSIQIQPRSRECIQYKKKYEKEED